MSDDRRYVSRQVEGLQEPISQARADPSKLAAVRHYFARKFPAWTITDRHGLDRIFIFTIEADLPARCLRLKWPATSLMTTNPRN